MALYNVTCKQCKSTRRVGIIQGAVGEVVDWLDNLPDADIVKIVSARKRFDGQWGWQCVCGNNDLWTPQESKAVENKQSPKPKEIADVVNNLKPIPSKFVMVGM